MNQQRVKWAFVVVLASVLFNYANGYGTNFVDDLRVRLMKFDRNRDGVIDRDEVSDRRLHGLFDRYDLNKDGKLTKDEIDAGMERDQPGSTSQPIPIDADLPIGATMPGRIAKPTGLGGGGNATTSDEATTIAGRPSAPPVESPAAATVSQLNRPAVPFASNLHRVGQVVPDDLRGELDLSDKQVKQIDELERDIEDRLKRILNARQLEQLKKRLSENVSSQGATDPK